MEVDEGDKNRVEKRVTERRWNPVRVWIKQSLFVKVEGECVSSPCRTLPVLLAILFRYKWVWISFVLLNGQCILVSLDLLWWSITDSFPRIEGSWTDSDVCKSEVWKLIKEIPSQWGWLSSVSGTEGQRTYVFSEMLDGWERCINAGY